MLITPVYNVLIAPLLCIGNFPGSSDIIPILISRGIAVDARDSLQQTALHKAAHKGGHLEVTCLIEHEAKINISDCLGHTPLHLAAKRE